MYTVHVSEFSFLTIRLIYKILDVNYTEQFITLHVYFCIQIYRVVIIKKIEGYYQVQILQAMLSRNIELRYMEFSHTNLLGVRRKSFS